MTTAYICATDGSIITEAQAAAASIPPGSLSITCNTMPINVISATFGRQSTSICPDPANRPGTTSRTSCALDITTLMQANCNNSTTCSTGSIRISASQDPCFGTVKYFTINYECIAPVNTGPACNSNQTCLDLGLSNYNPSISKIIGINQPFGNEGQVCVDTNATFNPTVQKRVPIDATICSSTQTCLNEGLWSYNPNFNQVIGINQPSGSIGQICVDPSTVFNPLVQKVVGKDKLTCESTQVCWNLEGDNSPLPTENPDDLIDWTSFAFGTVAGVLGTIIIAGVSYAIYKGSNICKSIPIIPITAVELGSQIEGQDFYSTQPQPSAPLAESGALIDAANLYDP